MIVTMTSEEFHEAWREECRDWFRILGEMRGPQVQKSQDLHALAATVEQRRRRGDLLLDRLKAKTLVVEGFVDPNREFG